MKIKTENDLKIITNKPKKVQKTQQTNIDVQPPQSNKLVYEPKTKLQKRMMHEHEQ